MVSGVYVLDCHFLRKMEEKSGLRIIYKYDIYDSFLYFDLLCVTCFLGY